MWRALSCRCCAVLESSSAPQVAEGARVLFRSFASQSRSGLASAPIQNLAQGRLFFRSFASASQTTQEKELRDLIRASFASDPQAAANILASELDLAQQARLFHTFEASAASREMSPKYLHDLFQHADEDASGFLSK